MRTRSYNEGFDTYLRRISHFVPPWARMLARLKWELMSVHQKVGQKARPWAAR